MEIQCHNRLEERNGARALHVDPTSSATNLKAGGAGHWTACVLSAPHSPLDALRGASLSMSILFFLDHHLDDARSVENYIPMPSMLLA
ncbi:hypothetical protein NM208_g11942 [Fusarium decemcellulare]|uniref:Uncharacterized protein n=1 Tax=Fusarium decemcellulare TaxID=57161 RepID=A0ACC1RQK8_9HYPO|nr:hypothetical protein NM208_g11942 [Fusarium decemcellulare]